LGYLAGLKFIYIFVRSFYRIGDSGVPYFVAFSVMIHTAQIEKLLQEELVRKDLFLVEASVKPGNKIVVYIDSMKGVTLEECISVSRYLENLLDRDTEDFELEVSSPGLDKPLKLPVQFEKNIGKVLDVVKKDGNKVIGTLTGIQNGIIFTESTGIVKDPATGKKRKEVRVDEIPLEEIKSAKIVISLKSKK
jgi:ribosome maturation factor RimP